METAILDNMWGRWSVNVQNANEGVSKVIMWYMYARDYRDPQDPLPSIHQLRNGREKRMRGENW